MAGLGLGLSVYSGGGRSTAEVDKTVLQGLVDEFHNRNDSTDYTTASWHDYLTAANAGESVLADWISTQQQVDDSVVAINLAKGNLVYIVDLKNAILTAQAYSEEDYTPASWAPFLIALNNAIDVRDDPAANQAEVNAAESGLVNAQNNLVLRADKTVLLSALNAASQLDEADYTPESWAVLDAAVTAGQGVHDDADATQQQVDDAEQAILDAIGNLEEAPDPISILGSKLAAWYTSGPVVSGPPPSCTIALNGGVATAFGFSQPTITDGNVFGNSSSADGAYVASTEFPVTRALPTTGKIVWIALDEVSISATYSSGSRPRVRAGFFGSLSDGMTPTRGAQIQRDDAGTWTLFIEILGGGSTTLTIPQPPTGQYAIGVGHDGEVYICSGATITALSSMYPDYANWMAIAADDTTPTANLVIIGTVETGDTLDTVASGRIITEQASLTDLTTLTMSGTGEDWCGNPIGGTSYVEGLYTTSSGETPVTVAGDPIGLRVARNNKLGDELLTNGSFDSGLTGWTVGASISATVVLGEAEVTFAGSAQSTRPHWFSSGPELPLGDNRSFYVEFDATHVSGAGDLQVASGFNISRTITVAENAGVKKRYKVLASGLFGTVGGNSAHPGGVVFGATAGSTVWRIDNVSLKQNLAPVARQATPTARPLWQTGPDRIVYDPDDALNIALPAISGGQIVISSPAGIWIDPLNFAGGTFSLGPGTYTGGPAGLWSLLGNAEMQVCILDDAMTGEEQDKLVAYLVAQGSPGLITRTGQFVTGGDFESGLVGIKGDSSGSSSTWALNAIDPISGTRDGLLVVTTPAPNGRPFVNFESAVSGTEIGKTYLVSIDFKSVSGTPSITNYNLLGGLTTAVRALTSEGKISAVIVCSTTVLAVYMGNSPESYAVQFDNVSVQEVILP